MMVNLPGLQQQAQQQQQQPGQGGGQLRQMDGAYDGDDSDGEEVSG